MFTPETLAEVSFGKKFGGGYNAEDVDNFFKQITEDYGSLYNENLALKTKMRVIVAKLEEYRSAEASMKEAVVNTQRSCDAMIAETKTKCASMIRDAEAAAIEADAKISLEEARVESARQVAARQIIDLQTQLESCLQLLAHIRENHKPSGPIRETPAAENPASTAPEKPQPKKTIPSMSSSSDSDMFTNLQFGRNYGNDKKR